MITVPGDVHWGLRRWDGKVGERVSVNTYEQ